MKKKVMVLLAAFLCSAQFMSAQSQQVNGIITAEDNEPLPGVNIVEKGTANGVVSDFDGNYSIEVAGPDAVLVFSSIGFATVEETVGGRTTIDVIMGEDAQALDEVVLVGYGTQRKQDLTGAIVSADLEQFQEAPNTSILQSLQGSLPGRNRT